MSLVAVRELGIPQLDALVAPVPKGSTIVFMNDPGIEAEAFLYQVAGEALQAGKSVIYVATNRAPTSIVDSIEEFGWDVASNAARLHFVDAFSALLGGGEPAAFTVDDPTDLGQFHKVLRKAAAAHPEAVLVLDGISTMVDQAPPERFVAIFPKIIHEAKKFEAAVALFTRWPYPEAVLDCLSGFDAVVAVKSIEDRIVFGQYFQVERAAWKADVDQKPRLFKTIKPGGVFVYIPKIVITGPHNAGKSSFIHSVSDSAVSVDRLGTTVAMDHGKITVRGMAADLFGTPGQERFDPILRTIAGQALGVIVVVDSTKPDTFQRAREMMEHTWRQGLPAIVAANKQDMPDALSPDEVARLIAAPEGVAIVGCTGKDRNSGRAVVEQLLDQITQTAADGAVRGAP